MHPRIPTSKNPLHLNHLRLCIGPFPHVPPSYRSMQTPVIQNKEKIPKEFVLDLKIPSQNLRFPNKNCFPDTKQTPKKSTSSLPSFFSAPCKPPDLKSPKRNPHQPKSTWIISHKIWKPPQRITQKIPPQKGNPHLDIRLFPKDTQLIIPVDELCPREVPGLHGLEFVGENARLQIWVS